MTEAKPREMALEIEGERWWVRVSLKGRTVHVDADLATVKSAKLLYRWMLSRRSPPRGIIQ
jgi:hypothetical protein